MYNTEIRRVIARLT